MPDIDRLDEDSVRYVVKHETHDLSFISDKSPSQSTNLAVPEVRDSENCRDSNACACCGWRILDYDRSLTSAVTS